MKSPSAVVLQQLPTAVTHTRLSAAPAQLPRPQLVAPILQQPPQLRAGAATAGTAPHSVSRQLSARQEMEQALEQEVQADTVGPSAASRAIAMINEARAKIQDQPGPQEQQQQLQELLPLVSEELQPQLLPIPEQEVPQPYAEEEPPQVEQQQQPVAVAQPQRPKLLQAEPKLQPITLQQAPELFPANGGTGPQQMLQLQAAARSSIETNALLNEARARMLREQQLQQEAPVQVPVQQLAPAVQQQFQQVMPPPSPLPKSPTQTGLRILGPNEEPPAHEGVEPKLLKFTYPPPEELAAAVAAAKAIQQQQEVEQAQQKQQQAVQQVPMPPSPLPKSPTNTGLRIEEPVAAPEDIQKIQDGAWRQLYLVNQMRVSEAATKSGQPTVFAPKSKDSGVMASPNLFGRPVLASPQLTLRGLGGGAPPKLSTSATSPRLMGSAPTLMLGEVTAAGQQQTLGPPGAAEALGIRPSPRYVQADMMTISSIGSSLNGTLNGTLGGNTSSGGGNNNSAPRSIESSRQLLGMAAGILPRPTAADAVPGDGRREAARPVVYVKQAGTVEQRARAAAARQNAWHRQAELKALKAIGGPQATLELHGEQLDAPYSPKEKDSSKHSSDPSKSSQQLSLPTEKFGESSAEQGTVAKAVVFVKPNGTVEQRARAATLRQHGWKLRAEAISLKRNQSHGSEDAPPEDAGGAGQNASAPESDVVHTDSSKATL